jgi:hypothetical protein
MSEPNTSSLDYALSFPDGSSTISADPFLVDTNTGRSIDEASDENEENCRFEVIDGRINIVATRAIEPGEQLFIRYGYEYWMNAKWPLALLRTMYTKYSPTLDPLITDEWMAIIRNKTQEQETHRLWTPRSILRYTSDGICPTGPITPGLNISASKSLMPPSKPRGHRQQLLFMPPTAQPALTPPLTAIQRRKRKAAQKVHRKEVIKGTALPRRVRPVPPAIQDEQTVPDILLQDWRKMVNPRHPTHSSLCTMSWSAKGSLYDDGAFMNRDVPDCLTHAAKLMSTYDVDVLWINDARFTKGTLDRHLHIIRRLQPDCRVIQFPTTHVKTGSHCLQNNQMGGAIAIVNYKWKSFVCGTSTDPMGMGILNTIDIRLDDNRIRLINVYFLPRTLTTGKATLHSRITRHQQQTSQPAWIKRMTSQEYLYHLTQLVISKARAKDWLVIVQGDFNRPLKFKNKPTELET